MKIPGSIRALYEERVELYRLLKKAVDTKINSFKNPRWHFESRVKSEQSFALKIETGRCQNLQELEDFFACTIVVENQNEINNAIALIRKCGFELEYRRPLSNRITHKRPDAFPFDDLRLYVRYKDAPTVKPTNLSNLLFEVQLKTYLQHAWSIATHDLIYKTKSISWSKQRIAFQAKAMLEHAEVVIAEAEALSNSLAINKTDKNTKKLNRLLSIFEELWDEMQLPSDLNRLAVTILDVLNAIDIKIQRLKEIILIETQQGRGTNLLNLSPYGIILQALFQNEEDKVKKYLDKSNSNVKFLITREMDVPAYVISSKSSNLVILE